MNPSEHKSMPKAVRESIVNDRLTSRQIRTVDGLVTMPSRERDSVAPIRATGEAVGAPTTRVPSAVRKALNPKTKRAPGMIYPIGQN
jgi:hypothetical protein